MRIGELAKRSGLTRDTLRFYERNGLIASAPEPGKSNSYRDYSEDTLITLDIIADAQAAGMTLADLVVFISQINAQEDGVFDGLAFLDERIKDVEERLEKSRRFLKTLKDTKAALARAPFPD